MEKQFVDDQKSLKNRLRTAESLRLLDHAIINSSGVKEALRNLIALSIERLNAEAASARIINTQTNQIDFSEDQGFSSGQIAKIILTFTTPLAYKAIKSKNLVYIENLHQSQEVTSLKELDTEGLVTYLAIPFMVKDGAKGVLEIFTQKLFRPGNEWKSFLDEFISEASVLISEKVEIENLRRSYLEVSEAYEATLELLSKVLDLHEQQIGDISLKVAEVSINLAKEMGVESWMLPHIRRGALLHDIGNIGVPDTVLFKSGTLTSEEREIIQNHTVYAYDLVSGVDYLKPALDIITSHHECWDGRGYPKGLKGEEIPLAARIFSVVDVWYSLNSPRPYRPAWTREKAIKHINENTGTHFDPIVVEKFLKLVENGSV